jgi:septal ring factor EnvC (AmiA/AmiB activator)
MRDDKPRPLRKRTPEEIEALDRAFAGPLDRAPNLTELTGCEDDMNQEDREAIKRHDLLIDENRDRITALMSEYRSDQKWLKEALVEQGKKLDRTIERLDQQDRTLHNGVKDRQLDIAKRLSEVEAALDRVATKDELVMHKEDQEKRNAERWQGQHRRSDDKYKTFVLTVSVIGTFLTLGGMIAMYLSLVI